MRGTLLHRILLYVGLAFLVPGLVALGCAIYEGPAAWSTDSQTFWGIPIALFVFWIGLAHAGTLLSAIFLALGIKFDRRSALLAELSTLSCLAVAVVFPLVHLGVVENFYMVAPFVDARSNFANVGSPLVWDFCCIAVYGILSLLFFGTHLKSSKDCRFLQLQKPMAWLLFPLVLWVHTVVSLDFATALVPEWRGAFFPIYFIVGAVYSGVALVNVLLCVEGYRVRLLERMMLVASWFLLVIWFWDFLLKGSFVMSAFIMAGVLPQLLVVEKVRDSRWCRLALCFLVLAGLFAERLAIVMPNFNGCLELLDYGMIAFSVGLFMALFFGLYWLLGFRDVGEGAYFGEVDGSDMALNENDSDRDEDVYRLPWTTEEFKTLRLPLLIGILSALLLCVWWASQPVLENIRVGLFNMVPLTYPVVALVATMILCLKFYVQNNVLLGTRNKGLLSAFLILGFLVLGMLYAGGNSSSAQREISAQTFSKENATASSEIGAGEAALLWNSRCASCHGADGKFNQKFVREFYPVPQKLDLARMDSLGADSLVRIIMNGRNNMNSYGTRISEGQARALVKYMQVLAKEAR